MTIAPRTLARVTPSRKRARSGFTLIEMVTSLAIMGMIVGSLASTMLLMSRTLPREGDQLDATARARRTADRIVRELSAAVAIIEATDRSVSFDVPDRDGDGDTERVAISWSGTSGDPVVMSINGLAGNLEENVHAFELAWSTQSRSTTSASDPVEEAEGLLASWNDETDVQAGIKASTLVGLFVRPRLASDASAYRVTRARLWLGRSGSSDGTMLVELRTANGLRPGTTTLSSVLLNELSLPASPGWVTVTFASVPTIAINTGVFVVVSAGAGGEPAIVPYASQKVADDRTSIAIGSRSLLTTSWSAWTDASMPFELFGRVTRPGTAVLTTTHTVGVRATVQVGADAATTAYAADALPAGPATPSNPGSGDEEVGVVEGVLDLVGGLLGGGG